jgi:hypothetical protein
MANLSAEGAWKEGKKERKGRTYHTIRHHPFFRYQNQSYCLQVASQAAEGDRLWRQVAGEFVEVSKPSRFRSLQDTVM